MMMILRFHYLFVRWRRRYRRYHPHLYPRQEVPELRALPEGREVPMNFWQGKEFPFLEKKEKEKIVNNRKTKEKR